MRFLAMFIFFMLGSLTLWILLIWGQAGNPTKMSQWIFDAYQKKQKIARSIKGKKIVIVAGSNALFGVNSEMIGNTFDLPVVNDSVNAGIELPCTLFMAQKVIDKGDIVIMPLEYPMFSYDGTAGVQMIDFLLSREPDCFSALSLREQFYVMWHVSFGRVIDGYMHKENKPVTVGLYGAHHIDAYGDQVGTEISEKSNFMYDEIKKHVKHPEIYGKEFDQDALGWDYLAKFILWCEERGAKVIFMPSTLMQDESYHSDPKERWFYTHLADEVRKRGWTYVGDPYDYMYDQALYFNTNFHLIDSARITRTQKMIDDLKRSGISLVP